MPLSPYFFASNTREIEGDVVVVDDDETAAVVAAAEDASANRFASALASAAAMLGGNTKVSFAAVAFVLALFLAL